MRNESVAVFVIVVVMVSGAVGFASWNGSPVVPFSRSTITTTETVPCFASTSEPGGNASAPDYGPLLGNLSALSVVEYAVAGPGNAVLRADLLVLNRSYTSSGPEYLVNVTVESVGPSTTVSASQGFTTTMNNVNQTTTVSVLGVVVSNGTMISLERSSGEAAVASQLTTFPLDFFGALVALNPSASSTQSTTGLLHRINSTVVTIGPTRMAVTNYGLPAFVIVDLLQGCGSETTSTTTVGGISHEAIQAGLVPGTDFTLVTQFSTAFELRSNSSSASAPTSFGILEKVTSFSAG